MFSIAGIDLLEQELLDHERTLLQILLQDKTTKKNIIWATDDYAELGEPYSFKKEILPELVTGEQDSLIQPRVEKALEHQTNRTRDKAEVFTPSWICNAQNNLVDEQWFGRKDVFNIQKEMSWKATTDKMKTTVQSNGFFNFIVSDFLLVCIKSINLHFPTFIALNSITITYIIPK